jgi:hypothetical protein
MTHHLTRNHKHQYNLRNNHHHHHRGEKNHKKAKTEARGGTVWEKADTNQKQNQSIDHTTNSDHNDQAQVEHQLFQHNHIHHHYHYHRDHGPDHHQED